MIFTGPASEYQTQAQQADQSVKNLGTTISGWQQSRDPYYDAIYSLYQQAYQPQAKYAAQDASRQSTFQAARTGQRGGSQAMSNQQTIQQQLAQALGGIEQQARAASEGQRAADTDAAANWLLAATLNRPGEALATQGALDASRARSGLQASLTGLDEASMNSQQAYQALLSQLYGGQMGGMANIINGAGAFGIGPSWIQNLGTALVGR